MGELVDIGTGRVDTLYITYVDAVRVGFTRVVQVTCQYNKYYAI